MLESMRRNSRSVIIYVLFGVIIAAFIISFGPGSRGVGMTGGTASYAAKVAGSTVSEADFHVAWMALTRGQVPAEMARDRRLKETLMNKLIERELFAQEAERLGFEVSDKEAEDLLADGKMVLLGMPRRLDEYVFKNGKFDYDKFKMVTQNQLGVNVKHFIEIEKRELLADRARDLLKVSVKVSPDEAKQDFVDRSTQVNLEFVRFSPMRYADDSEIPDAELDAYAAKHDADLKKQYEDRAFLYKKQDKQTRIRHIVFELKKDASPAEVEAAKKQIDAAAAKVKAGASFADVARATGSDEFAKKRGGLIAGWRKKGFTGLGPALDDKIFAAKTGDVIGPERTDRGFELVKVEGFREGDIGYDQVKRELAEDALRLERSKAKAKAEAESVLARAQKGEKLDSILPKEDPKEAAGEKSQKSFGRRLSDPPKVQETNLFSRQGERVPEIGVSKELVKKSFELKQGEYAGPFEVAGTWVIVHLKERKDPDMADFEKRKDEIVRDLERQKWAELLDDWSHQRCVDARDEGKLRVNDEVLVYEGLPPGKDRATKYEPCAKQTLF